MTNTQAIVRGFATPAHELTTEDAPRQEGES